MPLQNSPITEAENVYFHPYLTFDLCSGTKVATCDVNTITKRKISKSVQNSFGGQSSLTLD